MHQGQTLLPEPKEAVYEQQASVIIALVGLLICGIPTLLVAALLSRFLAGERTVRTRIIYYATSCLGALVTLGQAQHLLSLYHDITSGIVQSTLHTLYRSTGVPYNPLGDYLVVSVLTLPAAGILGGGMDAFNRARKALRLTNSVEEWRQAEAERETKRTQRLEERARQLATSTPVGLTNKLYIGTKMHGESVPQSEHASIGISQDQNWIVLDNALLNEHMFVLGATGAGKTTYLLRLAEEVLKNTTRDLILIDGKGEEELAQSIRALVWKYRGHDTSIVRVGGGAPGSSYNPFIGHDEAIYNRLLSIARVSAAEGNAEYFADVNRDLLSLISFAPGEPPRSLAEIRERLTLDWLKSAYEGIPEERDYVETITEERISGLLVRLLPFLREMSRYLQPDGFTLDKVHSAVFSIRALTMGDTARRFCRFLIEDVKDYVATRATSPDGGVLIIDEFGVFGNDNIMAVLSQARSKNYGVVLATQDYSNLGEERQAQNILSSTLTKVLMGTDYPEALGATAGTKLQVESSMQSSDEGPTGMTSARIQHAFKVHPDIVRRFQRGQSYIIRKGYALAVQMSKAHISQEELAALPPEVITSRTRIFEPSSEPAAQPAAVQSTRKQQSARRGNRAHASKAARQQSASAKQREAPPAAAPQPNVRSPSASQEAEPPAPSAPAVQESTAPEAAPSQEPPPAPQTVRRRGSKKL